MEGSSEHFLSNSRFPRALPSWTWEASEDGDGTISPHNLFHCFYSHLVWTFHVSSYAHCLSPFHCWQLQGQLCFLNAHKQLTVGCCSVSPKLPLLLLNSLNLSSEDKYSSSLSSLVAFAVLSPSNWCLSWALGIKRWDLPPPRHTQKC